jgi:chromosome segregation ATPase
MVAPGKYAVSLSKEIDGIVTKLSDPMEFEVVQMREGALKGSSPKELVEFWNELEDFQGKLSAASLTLNETKNRLNAISEALSRTEVTPNVLNAKIHNLRMELGQIEIEFYGSKAKGEVGEKNNPTIYSRLRVAQTGTRNSTYGPTPTHKRSLEIAKSQFENIKKQLVDIAENKVPTIEKELMELGAPWIEGQPLP